ncbi:acyl transferase domain-containing protein [Kribbella sp. VKM Ac-2527]|uniref:Acyl transferase domain-containing protein n=1 Tax=Kribbella caucasensis TaxID=2512215 RepID=A0A4R6KBT3_9ACTN|nr:beta-ketoacyl synthase N-terminal-like domain-containing protein [Kribbella sp. VKM Ac-2527]TDO47341.1 acyl transferase domain-containing protein [Kribbella sp. VKM Ac-2527]
MTAEPVAIVGMSVLFPGAPDLATYWRNLVEGVDAITDVPAGRWDSQYYEPDGPRRADRVYCQRGGFVDAEVDATGFGIMPNSVRDTEPDQLIALRVAAQAIADAGGDRRLPTDRQRIGVILGRGGYLTPGLVRLDQRVRTASQLVKTLGELMPELGADRLDEIRQAFSDQLGPEAPESAIGLVPNLAASRLANRLDLRGPAYTVDAACASSLVAVDHAVRELGSGRCDVVLAGGVHHCHDITLWSVFSQLGALSPSERIRPFHRDADGVLIGEGTGVVVLKRLADADRDGDRIYAVITGTGVASDGRTASLLNPDTGGQVRAVRQAWQAAGLDPKAAGSIGLIEAHGTATPAGDAAELTTLAEVFGPAPDGQRAVIGSVKSMIGHTMPAAGVAGLIKAALSVHHGVLPPTLHCDDPNPALAKTRFETVSTARAWEAPAGTPVRRRAAVNAFGFGGINAHVVLEQFDGAAPASVIVREPERVLRLAASDPVALAALLDQDDSSLLAAASGPTRLDSATSAPGPTRLGIVDPTEKKLALARKAVAKGRAWRGRNDIWFAPKPLLGAGGGKLAFVFPGLEGEFEPRADDLAREFGLRWPMELARAEVGDVGRHGKSVLELGRLLDAVLRKVGVVPDALAGHSVGEWTAMACGGIHAADEVDAFLAGFDPDALLVPGLAFAVIGAPAAVVLEALEGQHEVVLSHDNAPNQSLICGSEAAVEELVARFRERAVISQVLPFRSGFHTPMLAPYLDPIRAAAEAYTLHPQKVPIWSATTAGLYPAAADDVRELFVRHLLEPVRFRPMIEAMYADGFRGFVQLGVGQLGSLIGDTLHGQEHLVVTAQSPHRTGLEQLQRVVTGLWADGLEPGQSAAASAERAVRLELGGPLISLDDGKRRQLKLSGPDVPGVGLPDLDLPDSPIAAELSALMKETAGVAKELIAVGRTSAPRLHVARPARPVRPVRPEVLRVSVDSMPYLLDHCFFLQRPGWPDDGDRWPVVPATTVIDHLMRIAEQAAPGSRAIAVHDVRLMKWITAIPSVDVPIAVEPVGPGRIAVSLGEYSRAVVEVAPDFPRTAPAAWRFEVEEERAPSLTAAELYSERWMFHGPRFQGVTELTAIGARHVRAVLTTPDAPGALLDNVGQVLGYWIMSQLPERTTVFPVQLERIRFYGPHPRPGQQLECLVKITSISYTTLEAEMQLVAGGHVWAEFSGWRDRRFDSNPRIRAVNRRPGRNLLSDLQPGGWTIVHEQWPDLATRELIMRNQLGGTERDQYAERPPAGKRQRLLGRIAAKDAVRRWLWDSAPSGSDWEVYPAEIQVHNRPSGQPYLVGVHGRELPELTVSIAQGGQTGVAIVRPGPCGIDIEEIVEPPASTLSVACGPGELALLSARASGENEAVWFTRFWAAKEAMAKTLGTGLRGNPQKFEVIAAAPDRITVRVDGREHLVRTAGIADPNGARYIVAWTADDEQE